MFKRRCLFKHLLLHQHILSSRTQNRPYTVVVQKLKHGLGTKPIHITIMVVTLESLSDHDGDVEDTSESHGTLNSKLKIEDWVKFEI